MTSTESKDAVILLSGGLDSATVLAMAKRDGFRCHCMAFRYGQRHAVELACAERVASAQGAASFVVVDIDLRAFGNSALTANIDVPKGEVSTDPDDIPVTYVPARNTIFLSFALAKAEVMGAHDIMIGANAVDYSGYPDCRPAFLSAFETVANVGTKMGALGAHVRVHAPLLTMTKAEIIRTGNALGVDYSLTHSCYDPSEAGACGQCDSCALRARGFAEADVEDPTVYAP